MNHEPFYAYVIEQFIINSMSTLYVLRINGPRQSGGLSRRTYAVCMFVLWMNVLFSFTTFRYFNTNDMFYFFARMISMFLLIVIMIVFLDGPIIKKLFTLLSIDIILIPLYLMESLMMSLSKKYFVSETTLLYVIKLLGYLIITFLTLLILNKPIKKIRNLTFSNNIGLWSIVLFAYSSTLFNMIPNMWYKHTMTAWIVLSVWLTLLVLLLAYVLQYDRRHWLEQEQFYFVLQKNLMTEYENSLRKEMNETRKLRHDIANHMQTLQVLKQQDPAHLKSKAVSFAKNANEIDEEYNKVSKANVYCDNLVIQAAICNKINECKQNKIKLGVTMDDVSINGISEIDMLGLIYNLFDNAREACTQIMEQEKREILFNCSCEDGILHIIMDNSKLQDGRQNKKLQTTKKDKLRHGVGLLIVKNIVKKYHGKLQVCDEKTKFRVEINITL